MFVMYSCVLLLGQFLPLCIFVVGGVSYIYTCSFLVNWVRLCFGYVLLICLCLCLV